MKILDTKETEENIKKYMEEVKTSKTQVTINNIIEKDFISKHLPQITEYKATEDIKEKGNQFIDIINEYQDYIHLSKSILNVRCLEILSIMFSYDIICNKCTKNIDKVLEKYLNILNLNTVHESAEKIKYYSNCYFANINKAYDRGESVSDVINNVLTKKFAYNMYSEFVKSKDFSIKDKAKILKRASDAMIIKFGIITYADLYENIADMMKKECEDKDLFNNKEEYQKNKEMLYDIFEMIDFPQFFETIGDTPEQILLQSVCSSKQIDKQSPEFVMNVLNLLNEVGDKIGKFKRNTFYTELIESMQNSFNKLMDTESDEKIKECIKLYTKTKYTEKLDFSLKINIRKKMFGNKISITASESPVFVDMEKRISEKIIEFSDKDFNGCISFLKQIEEMVIGENKYVSQYKFRDEILPQMLGIELNNEDKVDLECKDTFEGIVKFVKRKAKKIKSKDDLGDYGDK